MRIPLLLLVLAACCLGQIQAPVTPQTGSSATITRTIQGSVIGVNKAPVPGAVVLLKDTKTLQVRSFLVQQNGEYHFFGLSSDINYELRAQHGDMMSKSKTVSVFDSHRVIELNLKLDKKKKL